MGIEKKIELVSNFGDTVIFDNAYFKVNSLNYVKQNITIYVDCFKEKNGLCVKTETYSFVPILEGDNFVKQAYQYLKTLEEFKDAKDV